MSKKNSKAVVRLAKGKRRLELEKHKLELEAFSKIVEPKIGMIELQGDDELHVSINDQALSIDDAENGARGK